MYFDRALNTILGPGLQKKYFASQMKRLRDGFNEKWEDPLQKYAFLQQNNFMRIDELPHHSSLFYKLNFVSRRQFS